MTLTDHFTLEELTHSDLGRRRGIDNTPPDEVVENLRVLAYSLEYVRARIGHPIVVSSGYRCPEINRALGSKDTSAHVLGWAADFTCPGYGDALSVARFIAALYGFRFDQLIHEFGAWVHLSVEPRMRMQTLTIDRNGTRTGLWP